MVLTQSGRAWLAATLAIVAYELGCGRDLGPTQTDVVLVVLDAAAASHFSLYGSTLKTTPGIDGLAENSVVWERAYAQAPKTLPSVGSLLTGRYPGQGWVDSKLQGVSLAEHLRASGYRTLAFIENPWLAPRFGFDRGFDVYQMSPDEKDEGAADESDLADAPTVERALDAMDASEGMPVFLYLHILPPHTPYTPPKAFRGRFIDRDESPQPDGYVSVALGQVTGRYPIEAFRSALEGDRELTDSNRALLSARYDENLAWADAQVEILVRGLRARGRLNRTLFILTGDHGEAFGEHGHYGHGSSLFDEQIRVPLIAHFPEHLRDRIGSGPLRRTSPVEIVDLSATVLDLLHLPASTDPFSVSESLFRTSPAPSSLVRSFRVEGEQAILDAQYKLIIGSISAPRLFELGADPDEAHDVAATQPDQLDRLYAAAWQEEEPEKSPSIHDFDDEARAQLERLGYAE